MNCCAADVQLVHGETGWLHNLHEVLGSSGTCSTFNYIPCRIFEWGEAELHSEADESPSQGSMDGRNWTSLRVHDGDATICHPGQFASWPIVGPPALLPFRFFRVALTGPAAGSVSNAWNLCICFLELYGYFR